MQKKEKENQTGHSRVLKFRAWDKLNNEMTYFSLFERPGATYGKHCEIMQITGLKDKNDLKEVYEGDIIDTNGKIKGNIYEIKEVDKNQFDLVIQGFCTKAWLTTYQNAVDRGCKYAE